MISQGLSDRVTVDVYSDDLPIWFQLDLRRRAHHAGN